MIWKWHRILAPVLRYLKIKILSDSKFGFSSFENFTSRNMQRICVIASRGKTEGSRMCSNLNSRSSRSYTSLTWATPWVSSETKRRCLKRASMKCFWKTWMEQLWETVDLLEQKWCRKLLSQKKINILLWSTMKNPIRIQINVKCTDFWCDNISRSIGGIRVSKFQAIFQSVTIDC